MIPLVRLPPRLPRLYLMTDAVRLPDWRRIIPNLPKGSGVILRDYNAPNRALIAEELAQLCRLHHVILSIGADAALAQRVKAGLHMPERLASPRLAAQCPHGQPLTMATHGVIGLKKAAQLEVDAAFLSPVFATKSHAQSLAQPPAQTLGPVRLAALIRQANLPIMALGGMTPDTFHRLSGLTLHGFAAINYWREKN